MNKEEIAEINKDFEPFEKLGRRRTIHLLNNVVQIGNLSMKDALAAAYLQGVWDGWVVRENQIDKII